MRFAYKDKNTLATLRPGDLVEGTLRVERAHGAVRNYELSDLQVTKARAARASGPRYLQKQGPRGAQQHRLLAVGEPVPDFTMTNQDGQGGEALRPARQRRRTHVYLYSMPASRLLSTHGQKVSELAQRIGAFPERARQIRLISLSFDPEHDTPEVLRKHAQIRGAAPPLWTYAVASHAELAKIGVPLGLFYQPGDTEIAHNLCYGRDRSRGELGPAGNRHRTEQMGQHRSAQNTLFLASLRGKVRPG